MEQIEVTSNDWTDWREFDIIRVERTIEKMFELGWAPTSKREGMKEIDLIAPIAKKIVDCFDLQRPIKQSWILKAIEREIEWWLKEWKYSIEIFKWMIDILKDKWHYNV